MTGKGARGLRSMAARPHLRLPSTHRAAPSSGAPPSRAGQDVELRQAAFFPPSLSHTVSDIMRALWSQDTRFPISKSTLLCNHDSLKAQKPINTSDDGCKIWHHLLRDSPGRGVGGGGGGKGPRSGRAAGCVWSVDGHQSSSSKPCPRGRV